MVLDEQHTITLPVSIVSPTDIARLTREIEAIDNFFREQQIRNAGAPNTPPRLSKLMDQLASDNQKNLLVEEDRKQLVLLLEKLHATAPVMHISFSVDPPGAYVQKIVEWLRNNVHSYVLVTVGLQPNIGAGCIVRTTNKLFDFSLREFFYQKRDFFIEKMHSVLVDIPQTETVASPVQTQATAPLNEAAPESSTPIVVATSPTPAQVVQTAPAPVPITVKMAPTEVAHE